MNRDLTSIDPATCTSEQWASLWTAFESRERLEVSRSVYWHFLEVLPPMAMSRTGFVFREGAGLTIDFWQAGDAFYAKGGVRCGRIRSRLIG